MTAVECQVIPDAGNVRLNAAGNPVKSVPHTLSGVRSMLRSLPRRVGLFEFDTPDLARLNELHSVIDAVMAECVRQLRSQGDSWADIGRELGITRQSAQERFGR